MPTSTDTTQRSATISVLVDNEAGVLARVIGLFSGRGYNIDSLTVAPVDAEGTRTRINIVTSGTEMVIEQIKAQLDRLVPVHRVADLTIEGPHVAREMALVKVIGTGEQRVEALRIADTFRARVVDTTLESFVFELTGATDKLDAFIELMRPSGPGRSVAHRGRRARARHTDDLTPMTRQNAPSARASCRRRPASTTCLASAREVAVAGAIPRHDAGKSKCRRQTTVTH